MVGWSEPLGVVLNALSRPLVALVAARQSPGHSMPSGLLGAVLLLSAILAVRRPPDHLTTSLPLNATLATQHPPDRPGLPGRRCSTGDRTGTFCPESQLESPIYFNQSRSRHASLGRMSTTEPCKDYHNPNSWSRIRGHQSWGPFSPESELEQEPSGH